MAKNTLSFGEVKQGNTITTSSSDTISSYQVDGTEATCVCDASVTLNGNEYGYDDTIGDITLNPGDSIERPTTDTNGTSNLLVLGWSTNKVTELTRRNPKYTNTSNKAETVKLGVFYIYRTDSSANTHTYVKNTTSPYYTDKDNGFEIKAGDTIRLTSDIEAVLVDGAGNIIEHFYHAGESKVIKVNCYPCFIAAKSTSASVSFEIIPEASRREYECEYDGGSGILQLRHSQGARVSVYGDAGAGYMLIHKMEGREIVRVVNMDGFNKLKFVSDGQVDECIINEF